MVDPNKLRIAAFTLAREAAHGKSQRTLAAAITVKRELQEATHTLSGRKAWRHWLHATAVFNVVAEWQLKRARQRLRRAIVLQSNNASALSRALEDEERARFAALLGRSDGVPVRVLLRRLSHNPALVREAATCFRTGAIVLDNGRVRSRTAQRACGLAVLVVSSEAFLAILGRTVPQLWTDTPSRLSYLAAGAVMLAYLFWPLLKRLRTEISVRNQINATPRLRRV